jgi:hypothetical protein
MGQEGETMKIFEVNPYEVKDLLRKAEDYICKELVMRVQREEEFKGKPQICAVLPQVGFLEEEGATDDSVFSNMLKEKIEKAAEALVKRLRHGNAVAISQLYAMPSYKPNQGKFELLMVVKYDAGQEAAPIGEVSAAGFAATLLHPKTEVPLNGN